VPPLLLEVIVQSVADARAATDGGADRLEVVRAIREGGLTPPLALVHAIAAETSLPLRVMVRENAGYAMDARELPALRRAAAEFFAAGVDGIVIGFARAAEPSLDDLASVLDAAPGVRATFHRAFDALRDPLRAIDTLAGVAQVDRILTSGGEGAPGRRADRLREYSARAGARLTIIAGSGVDDEAIVEFRRGGWVREVHAGRAAREGGDPEGPVSLARVRRLAELAHSRSR
jgi:copper homeostasis protein